MTKQDILKPYTKEIIELYLSGISMNKIGKKYKVNSAHIWQLLINNNIKTKKRKNFEGKLTDYQNQIEQMFNDGKSCYAISKEIGISKPTVLRYLKSIGKDTSAKLTRDPNNLIADKFDEILSRYESGEQVVSISRDMKLNPNSIIKLLKNKNKFVPKLLDIDETFFEKIDTAEKAYFLGILYSDGNIKRGMFRVAIVESDIQTLEHFKSALKFEGKIRTYDQGKSHHKKMCELAVTRIKMIKDLEKLGLVENKSLILKFPTFDIVPEQFMKDFILGVFDGDGSASGGRPGAAPNISLTGSHAFIDGLKSYLEQNVCQVTGMYQRYKDRVPEASAHCLQICRGPEKVKFVRWLYSAESSAYCMQRKRESAKKIYPNI